MPPRPAVAAPVPPGPGPLGYGYCENAACEGGAAGCKCWTNCNSLSHERDCVDPAPGLLFVKVPNYHTQVDCKKHLENDKRDLCELVSKDANATAAV